MTQEPHETPTIPPDRPKGRNTTLIVVLVLLVLCCACALVLGALWQFGDQLLYLLGITL